MPSSTIKWLIVALQDLHAIGESLAAEDPQVAQRVAQHIWDAGQSLATAPSRGRPGRVAETRELVLVRYPYFLAYRVLHRSVHILRVLHPSRQNPA